MQEKEYTLKVDEKGKVTHIIPKDKGNGIYLFLFIVLVIVIAIFQKITQVSIQYPQFFLPVFGVLLLIYFILYRKLWFLLTISYIPVVYSVDNLMNSNISLSRTIAYIEIISIVLTLISTFSVHYVTKYLLRLGTKRSLKNKHTSSDNSNIKICPHCSQKNKVNHALVNQKVIYKCKSCGTPL